MSQSIVPDGEKKRICPSCRMQISILAVKCRFCGEEVGKPKEEQRTLSINDLGGEVVSHRAPSGSVIDALEAFRVEENMDMEGETEDVAGGYANVGDVPPSVDGMPVSPGGDFGSSSVFDAEESSITSVHQRKAPGFQARAKTIGLALAGILVLVIAGLQAPKFIKSSDEANAIPTDYTNRALVMLEQGLGPIDALTEAVGAIGIEDSDENRRIAEEVLSAVVSEVDALLMAQPFDEGNLNRASRKATKALDLYPNDATIELAEKVKEDNRAYKIVFTNIDGRTGEATYILNRPGAGAETKKKGEVIDGRFEVLSVTSAVRLIDRKRGGRVVRYEEGSSPL